MLPIGAAEWTVAGVTLGVTLATVGLHFEVLAMLNRWVIRQTRALRPDRYHRPTLMVVMLALLLVHVVEIWLFGIAYWALMHFETLGSIGGYDSFDLLDCVYFSATTYSTVGWGDLWPIGPLRLLAGTESLIGFMLITWSASFTYLVMARTWGSHQSHG
ncbi:potassium channel family protein [Wenzhouxiangella marina]|uniref:Ion transport 2 n=1 Tax=Wenzhouxiangella marina TaxID=1579979 RepID=A0A0K0XVJ4_9GAMM|nr:potassium channel family protein [Wenzhouxiangella marina]AKS41714.1 Ion transport 2 [Wenzhouxiangella marina]MBB6086524.1 hypothetical protein [Wenzhouxiangella marina]